MTMCGEQVTGPSKRMTTFCVTRQKFEKKGAIRFVLMPYIEKFRDPVVTSTNNAKNGQMYKQKFDPIIVSASMEEFVT